MLSFNMQFQLFGLEWMEKIWINLLIHPRICYGILYNFNVNQYLCTFSHFLFWETCLELLLILSNGFDCLPLLELRYNFHWKSHYFFDKLFSHCLLIEANNWFQPCEEQYIWNHHAWIKYIFNLIPLHPLGMSFSAIPPFGE